MSTVPNNDDHEDDDAAGSTVVIPLSWGITATLLITSIGAISRWLDSASTAMVNVFLAIVTLFALVALWATPSGARRLEPAECFLGIGLLLAGVLIGSSPTAGPYAQWGWNQVGLGVLEPPTETMYSVEDGKLVPGDVPNGYILVYREGSQKPMFITNRTALPSTGAQIHLQELSSGRTSPSVIVKPE